MSADNHTVNTAGKGFMELLNPSNWSLKRKTILNFLFRAVVAIGLLVGFTNLVQRKMTINDVNDHLVLINDTKAQQVENYFSHLNDRIRTFASSRQSIDAFNQLNSAFNSIESENYLPPTVNDLSQVNKLLEGYYKTEILPQVTSDENLSSALKSLLPGDNKQRILQFLYIASNTKPLALKGSLVKADDGSTYTYMHSLYHSEISLFARQAAVSDVIFADYATGYVIYSMKKNLDFGTNLFEGPYRNSGLGLAFKSAISQQTPGAISYTDATVYPAAYNKPCLFISVPVFNGSQMTGVLIVALDNIVMDNILAYEKEGIRSLHSMKSILVGSDLLYRSDDPAFLSDRDDYLRKLKRNASTGEIYHNAERINSTSLVQHIDKNSFNDLLRRKSGTTKYETQTGEVVFSAFKPITIGNLNWGIITQINRSEAMASLHRFMLILTVLALVIASLLYYISGILVNSISARLHSIKEGLLSLTTGELDTVEDVGKNDEIGIIGRALNELSSRMQATTLYASELSKGNVDVEFPVLGERDKFGLSLKNVKESLIISRAEEEKRKQEDELRNWTNHGIALFNDIMRTEIDDLEKLSLNIIRNLVQYLSANQGGLFLLEEEEEQPCLNLISSYAYDRQKFLKKRIAIGEGMAGTCVLEKKSILTNKLPDDYLTITSGLGGAKPRCLLVVPLNKDEEILGVIEIASFNDFKPHEVEFVEKVAESIASALITVKLHLQTTQYLERFQQQAEEMKAQDEELRQNIEELQATHEQMERMKEEDAERNRKAMKEMEDFRKLLIAIINEIPEKIFLKDDKGRFIVANKPVAENYGKTVEEILGKSDFDFYPHDQASEYFRLEQEIIKSGRTQTYEEGDPSKYDGLIVRTIKKPFYIENMGVTGLFGVQFDITDIKRKEYESGLMAEELKLKQKELEASTVELEKETSLLNALLESVPEHIFFKDRESRFIRFSKSMLKLFGLKDDSELLGKTDFDLFAEEHARPAFNDEQKIIATGEAIIDFEEKEVMEDGRVNFVNTSKLPLKNEKGEIIGTFGISKDISRIKNMETQAKEITESVEKNRKLLIDILNKIPAKIFLKDENGAFVVVNEAVSSIYNKSPEQIIGTTDFDNHPDDDVASWRKQELEIIESGEKTYLHVEKVNGRETHLKTTKSPFVMSTTGKTGLLGIQLDVTDLKIMEDEVKRLRDENEKLKKSAK